MKRKLIKIISFILVFNIILIPAAAFAPANQYHKVQAASMVDNINTLAVVTLLLASMATAGTISAQQSLSPANISTIADKINAGGDTLIAGVNKLGNAIKTGADKATVKALASGAIVYGMLQAMQDVLFYKPDIGQSTYGVLIGLDSDYGLYANVSALNDIKFNNIQNTYKIGIDATNLKSGYSVYQAQSRAYFTLINKTDGKIFTQEYSDLSYDSSCGYFYSVSLDIKHVLFGTGSYNESATTIANASSVSVPTYLPQTIINNITSYDGTSDVVLGLPDGTTYTGDDLLTVDPTTVPIDNPSTPVDPPVEEDNTTIGKILAALIPISGILSGIQTGVGSISDVMATGFDSVIDGIGDIAGTLTGGITSSLSNVQSSLSSLTAPTTENINLDPVKNIPKVLFAKFPFCIPWDLYNVYNLMATDNRSPPEFKMSIPLSNSATLSAFGMPDLSFDLKLENYEEIAGVVRTAELLLFVIGLIFATKKLIWS